MPGSPYQGDGAKVRRVEDVIGRLESIPGVQAAGASNLIPLDGGGDVSRVEVDGVAIEPGREPRLFFAGVTAHYLAGAWRRRCSRARLHRGRGPVALGRRRRQRQHGPPPLRPARRRGAAAAGGGTPGRGRASSGAIDPVGRRFRLLDEPGREWFTVIGVVPDVMIEEVGEREVTPAAFLPYAYQATPNTGLLVRATGDAVALTPQIRAAIRASDPGAAGVLRQLDGGAAPQGLLAVRALRADVRRLRRARPGAGGGRRLRRAVVQRRRSGRRSSACAWRSAPSPATCRSMMIGQGLRLAGCRRRASALAGGVRRSPGSSAACSTT